MTFEEQKIYDRYVQNDVDIEDLSNKGWSCKVCPKDSPRNKLECDFTDCLTNFILSGNKLNEECL